MKYARACWWLTSAVLLGSCQSEKAVFSFSSRPLVAVAPTAPGSPAAGQVGAALPSRDTPAADHTAGPREHKAAVFARHALPVQLSKMPVVAARQLVPRPHTTQHVAQQHRAPREGGAKAFAAIARFLSVVVLLLGLGLLVAGATASSVGVGAIIGGVILFGLGLAALITFSKY